MAHTQLYNNKLNLIIIYWLRLETVETFLSVAMLTSFIYFQTILYY